MKKGAVLIFDSSRVLHAATKIFGVDTSQRWAENNRASVSCCIDNMHLGEKLYENETVEHAQLVDLLKAKERESA
jgi:hypothetical protein